MKTCAIAATLITVVLLGVTAEADAARTVRVGPSQAKTIRGDVLWMRMAADRAPLAPFALDSKGRQCWAPASVFEESCTMAVSRRINGRRTLTNESGAAVNVRYVPRW
jgi:hypothetical protein